MTILYTRYHTLRSIACAGMVASSLIACGGGSDISSDASEQAAMQMEGNDQAAAALMEGGDQSLAAGRKWFKRQAPVSTTTPITTEPTDVATTPTTTPSETPTSDMVPYERVMFGQKRGYNFDGSTPFVNPAIGQSNMEEMFYNAQFLAYDEISNSGVSPWITKFNDGGTTVTRYQVFPTDAQIWSWRTQTSSFPFEMYKHYRWDMEFKLDPSWNLNMGSAGDGLFWQAKGSAKVGQFSNAAMSLGLRNDNLYFSVLYPNSAMNATTWPTSLTWTNSDYVATNFPTKKLVAGRYYKVRMEFFTDDRPAKFGGQGYLNVWLDDQLWIQHTGPNLHPDSAREHRWDFGWYNWGGQPTSARTVYYKTARASVK